MRRHADDILTPPIRQAGNVLTPPVKQADNVPPPTKQPMPKKIELPVLGPKCFVAGTQVLVRFDRDGRAITKAIEDIEVGDTVLSRFDEDGLDGLDARPVVRLFGNVSDHVRVLRLRAADGTVEELRTTDDHPFWLADRGWVRGRTCRRGMRLNDANEAADTVVLSSEREVHPEGIAVFNFEVAGDHTYFVEAGRFVRQDPICFAGGDDNLYHCTASAPTNYADSTGHASWLRSRRSGGRTPSPPCPARTGTAMSGDVTTARMLAKALCRQPPGSSPSRPIR